MPGSLMLFASTSAVRVERVACRLLTDSAEAGTSS
jgi:hypothetical protein